MDTTRAQFEAVRSSVIENRSAHAVPYGVVVDALDIAIANTPEPKAEKAPEPEPAASGKGKK